MNHVYVCACNVISVWIKFELCTVLDHKMLEQSVSAYTQ